MSMKNLSKVFALALVAGLTVGCASTSDVQRAQNDANEAKSMARNAMDTANEAKSMASEARSISMANEKKLNRVNKRTMLK